MENEIDYSLIGDRIRQARKEKGWSQEKLSEEIDVATAFLSRVERGHSQINLKRLAQISKALDVPLEKLVTGTDVEMLATAIQSYKDIDAWNDTPILKEESFNRLQEVMTEAGELKQKAPYDKIVNNTYAEKVIK